MPRDAKDKAADRHVDSWGRERKDGRWTRIHRSARRALFTPFKVAGGPSSKTPLTNIRITREKFFASGKTFKVIDDWTVRANAHRLLDRSWIGTTDVREVADYVDDDSDEEQKRSEGEEDDNQHEEPRLTAQSAEPDKMAETEYFELSPARLRVTEAAQPDELSSAAVQTEASRI